MSAGSGPVWPGDRATRLARWMLGRVAGLVPEGRRRAWGMEWEGELWQLRTRGDRPVRLAAFLTGAIWHATWERMEGWTMETFVSDLRLTLRGLARSPGFTLAAITLLTLGIGGSTALYSLLEEAVLSAPPYPDPERIVVVDNLFAMPESELQPSMWSYARFEAYRAESRAVVQPAAYGDRTLTLTDLGDAAIVSVEVVSPAYFSLLGVQASLGRVFSSEEEDQGAPTRVAVIGEAFWHDRLGGALEAIGSSITLDRVDFRILGVLPAGFGGLTGGVDVWVPASSLRALEDDQALEDPWKQYFHVVGRLMPGVELEVARAEAQRFGATILERFPPPPGASRLRAGADVVPFLEARVNPLARTSMLALFGAVSLMLLAATANLAALMLARGAGRRVEAAVRASLGAGRGRLLGQLLAESLTLAAIGGATGVLLARVGMGVLGGWLTDAVGTQGGRSLQYLDPGELSLDWSVLGFALLLTVSVGVLCGIAPAWQAARTDPGSTLRAGGGSVGRRRGGRHDPLRGGLVVVQVGLAVVLLTGAALTLRSVDRLQAVDLGFEPAGLLTATYTLTAADREAGVDPVVFHPSFLEAVRSLPGVADAALGEVPMEGPTYRTIVMGSEGRPDLTPEMHTWIRLQPASEGYLELLGARLSEGRTIAATDGQETERVVVLNRSAASALFPDGSPLGRTIQLPWPGYMGGTRVVGVVDDLEYMRPGGPAELQGFLAVRQAPQLASGLLVRVGGDPLGAVRPIRAALSSLNPNVALTDPRMLEDRLAHVTARPRVVSLLLTVFAAVALLLVGAGLYGVLAFSVARRTREIGLRASLGADSRSLLTLIVRQGMSVTAGGVLLGLLGAWWLTPFLESLLFGVEPLDPAAFVGASAGLLAVGLLASWMPARRATRIDPMRALRSD